MRSSTSFSPIVSCIALTATLLCSGIVAQAAPLPVIFDTDMDSDVDDVAALCKLHAMADQGEVELLGVMVSGHNEWSAPCIDAVNTFYGRPDVPIGLVSSERGIMQKSPYAQELATEFPQDFREKQDGQRAVDLYRQILAARPDNSVTLISVGDTTNMAALLASGPDQFSPLDGRTLISRKVKEYVCMGSRYPADVDPTPNRWGNFRTDPISTKEVVANWPTTLTFTGGGKFADTMAIGRRITQLDPKVWPVSRAYQLYFEKTKQGPLRHSADSIAVYVAVKGFEPYFKVVDQGHNEIDDVGRNAWKAEPDSANQRYTSELNNPEDAAKLAALFEDLSMQVPAKGMPRQP